MKRLIFMLLMLFSSKSIADTCDYRSEFTDYQWNNIRSVYINGWYTDLKWSLSAITIVETSAGLDIINERTHDYGLMQNNIKTAMIRLKRWEAAGRDFGAVDVTNREDVIELLLTRPDISVQLAVEELRFWVKVRGENWHEVYASYNGGYYKEQTWEVWSTDYANKVTKALRRLKQCEALLNKGL